MFTFDINKYVPKFLLNDRNGYALSKAIEAAMQYMNDIINAGVNLLFDYDTMPEWRLDEIAWETNCLYDYNADIEQKREWIKNTEPFYRMYGTPMAIYQYLAPYFDSVTITEDGDPFHFSVYTDGDWTQDSIAWAVKAINTAKNVRSVLDSLQIGSYCSIGITVNEDSSARISFPITGPFNICGLDDEL